MNNLPDDRLIIRGRTHREMWRPEQYGGIQRALDDNERAARTADRVILVMFLASVAWWLWEVFA